MIGVDAGGEGVMAEMWIYPKLVVRLITLRSEQQIRIRLAPLQQEYKVRLQALAGADSQTAITGFEYRLKVAVRDDQAEVYPKLVIVLDTTRTEPQIRSALDDVYADLKQSVRSLVASDPQTSIVSWHAHLSTGSVDEAE